MTTLKRRIRQRRCAPPVLMPPKLTAAEAEEIFHSANASALWVLPEPIAIRNRPPVPMTREQSRAYKRIQRVVKVRDRWEKKRERETIRELQAYRRRVVQGFAS